MQITQGTKGQDPNGASEHKEPETEGSAGAAHAETQGNGTGSPETESPDKNMHIIK